MPTNATNTLRLPRLLAPLLTAGIFMLAPRLASADSVMLLMQSGPENGERMKLLGEQLQTAGHQPMVTGASLEDSALMLGCDPSTAACLDTVIETAGADAAVVVPQHAGDLLVHRQGVGKREAVAAGASDYDWQLALSKTYGLPAPPAPPSEVPDGVGLSSSGSASSSGGGLQFSKVKKRSWIVLGSGIASTGVGLVLLSVASGKQDEVDKHPVDTAGDLRALRNLESSGKNFNRAGNLVFVAGGIATLAGIGLMVLDMKVSGDESGPTVVPTASESGVGVSVRWANF